MYSTTWAASRPAQKARANSRVVCNSFFMGESSESVFIKDRSCFRSNYFKYIETEAVLFPEPAKEGDCLWFIQDMAGKPAVLFGGGHNPVSQFEKIVQAVPVIRMDRTHQAAIGSSHQILLCAGHELILKSLPLKPGRTARSPCGPPCQGPRDPGSCSAPGCQGITRKMNDEKGSQTIMFHCLKDDSSSGFTMWDRIYSSESVQYQPGSGARERGFGHDAVYFCCVGGACRWIFIAVNSFMDIIRIGLGRAW